MLKRINFSQEEISQLHSFAKDIPVNPLDRIDKSLKDILLSDRNILYDAHAHIFTAHHVPSDFNSLLLWIPRSQKTKLLRLIYERMGDAIDQFHPNDNIRKLLQTYYRFIKDSLPEKDTHVILCSLMMDMERGISNRMEHDFKKQIIQMIECDNSGVQIENSTYRGTESFITFFAADPHNPDLYKQFISGFVKDVNLTDIEHLDNTSIFQGIKLYPVLGFYPDDPILWEIYEIAQEKKIPITTHCGGIRTRSKFHKIEVARMTNGANGLREATYSLASVFSKKEYKNEFIDPNNWLNVLKNFPNLKLNLAHFGDDQEWKKYRKNQNADSFVKRTIDIISNPAYPNVYADISYALQDPKNYPYMISLLNQDRLKHKVLCGTDYFLNEVTPVTTYEALTAFYRRIVYTNGLWTRLSQDNPNKFFFNI